MLLQKFYQRNKTRSWRYIQGETICSHVIAGRQIVMHQGFKSHIADVEDYLVRVPIELWEK